jgi:hypothetical protein
MHGLSRNSITATRNPVYPDQISITAHLTGYANVGYGSLIYLTEMINESANIEALDYLRKSDPKHDYIKDIGCSYHMGVIFLDMLVEEIAKKTSQTHEQVRKLLYGGHFEGKTQNLRIFNQVFGDQTLRVLAKLKDNSSIEEMTKLASAFGLDAEQYKKTVEKYELGEEITLNSGVKINRKI